ncbi:class I SAM-dependent methyltransferase [Leptothoe sp. ISB3NOV94-8A]
MADSSSNTYKQQVLNDFNNRINYENEFHRRAAARLVELSTLRPGQYVLDVATGTGLAAIAAAQIVGSTGYVLGTDFSIGMLRQAKQKLETLGLKNIEFAQVDADEQTLPEKRYDAILCSSAIVYLTDIPTVLHRWYRALQPQGIVAFSCLAESSPSASVLFRQVVRSYGINIPNPNELLGSHERCRDLLEMVGFRDISLITEQFGRYLQDIESVWTGNARSAFGLQDVEWSNKKLEQCRQEYFAEIEKVSDKKGYWNDVTMFFVTARKPNEVVT